MAAIIGGSKYDMPRQQVMIRFYIIYPQAALPNMIESMEKHAENPLPHVISLLSWPWLVNCEGKGKRHVQYHHDMNTLVHRTFIRVATLCILPQLDIILWDLGKILYGESNEAYSSLIHSS